MFETLLQSNRNLGTKSENFLLIDLPLLTGKLPDDLRLRLPEYLTMIYGNFQKFSILLKSSLN